MSALVIDFAAAAQSRRGLRSARAAKTATSVRHPALSHDFMFWSGASGMRYVHTVYQLLSCPEVPDANIVLARRLQSGECEQLDVLRVENGSPSLNLADIRHAAAELGANEIHVHLLAGNAQHRQLIENDLRNANATSRDRAAS
jgi:hypothetical protein